MEVEHTNIHPLTTLRPGLKPQTLDNTRPFERPEQAAPQKASPTDRAPAIPTPAPVPTPGPAPVPTPAATNVTLSAVDPDSLAGGPGSKDPLTVDGLLEEWGQKGPRYDLDGNGTVDMSDLLELLASLSEPASGPQDPKPAPDAGLVSTDETVTPPIGENAPPAEPPEPMTIDGLMEAWGEKGSRYDLDGDGRVNMPDLLEMLARMAARANAVPDPEPGISDVEPSIVPRDPGTPDPTIVADPGPPLSTETLLEEQPAPQLTIQGLLDAWGERRSQYDLDGNGTVNMRDLLALLAELSPDRPRPSNGAVVLKPSDTMSRPGDEARGGGRVGRIAESLLDRLEQRGFEKHPPTNIHQIVSRLELPPNEQKGVIHSLSRHYPEGLGINVVS